MNTNTKAQPATAAELNTFPIGTVCLDRVGIAWQKYDNGWRAAVADDTPTAGGSDLRPIHPGSSWAGLDALPLGAVCLDQDGDACQKYSDGWRAAYADEEPVISANDFEVIYRP